MLTPELQSTKFWERVILSTDSVFTVMSLYAVNHQLRTLLTNPNSSLWEHALECSVFDKESPGQARSLAWRRSRAGHGVRGYLFARMVGNCRECCRLKGRSYVTKGTGLCRGCFEGKRVARRELAEVEDVLKCFVESRVEEVAKRVVVERLVECQEEGNEQSEGEWMMCEAVRDEHPKSSDETCIGQATESQATSFNHILDDTDYIDVAFERELDLTFRCRSDKRYDAMWLKFRTQCEVEG